MRISDNVQQVTGIYTNDKKVSRTENINKVGATKDNIEISNVGKDFAVAQKALKDVPDIRQDKIDAITAKIEKGEYKIDGDAIVNKIMNGIIGA